MGVIAPIDFEVSLIAPIDSDDKSEIIPYFHDIHFTLIEKGLHPLIRILKESPVSQTFSSKFHN